MRSSVGAILTLGALILAGRALAGERPRPSTRPTAGRETRPLRGRYTGDVPWDDLVKFMRENCPVRWAAYEKLPDKQKQDMRPLLSHRYRMIVANKEANPELYELRLKQIRIEDRIFDLHEKRSQAGVDEDALKTDLRKQVAELVDLRLKERERRIERIRKFLEEEEGHLKRDQANKGALIEKECDTAWEHGAVWPLTSSDRPGRANRPEDR